MVPAQDDRKERRRANYAGITSRNGIRRFFQDVTIKVEGPAAFSVAWDAYKAKGPLETRHGDIAFLVRCDFRGGAIREGVGFLEAKRVYEGRYDALEHDQLAYQASNVQNHHLLLYDYEPIHEASQNLVQQGFCRSCNIMPYGGVHAAVVPTHHATAVDNSRASLNPLSTPLSHQICCRYLRGLDLDWKHDLVTAVKSGAKPGIRFLFVAHAIIGGEGVPNSQAVEFKRERYQPLED